jgi:hypothetical protein
VELAEYQQLSAAFRESKNISFDSHGFILILLRLERLEKCIAINPEAMFQDSFTYHQTRLISRLVKQWALYSIAESRQK